MTEPVAGRKPVLALLMRLLWAAALALPVFGAQAAVVLTTLYSFSGDDGASPPEGLVQGSDGNFYGTTQYGGTNGLGTVFRISTNGALTSLYSFTGTNDGANPTAGLLQGRDGYFYGTTYYGGTNNSGTVFKISTNGALTSLYSFTHGTDGEYPFLGLVQGSDGNFYGTTSGGGSTGGEYPFSPGTVFKIGSNGVLTTLYSFTGGNDGANPYAVLVQGSDGNFYGTTEYGGTNGVGTVFKMSANGALTSLYSFTGTNDGANPVRGLVQGSDGNFYGTTQNGGTNGWGTVFKITTNGAVTTLYSFAGGNDGANPEAVLVQGSDGNLYGTTQNGGTNGWGTVFKITTNGALTSLYSFTGGNDGAYPHGLVQGNDGNFYGMTVDGGLGGVGTVLRLTMLPGPTYAATATATVVNDFVVGATVTDGGFGYTNTPTVRVIGGGGSGAQAVAVVSNGVVVAVNILAAGGGYTNAPVIVIAPPFPPPPVAATATATLVNDFVVGATITDGGYGYTNTRTVSIIGGGGSGAQAVAVVSNGVVIAVNILDAGDGYTNPPAIVIAPPFIPPPTLGIAAMSLLSFTNLALGTNYQLQSFSGGTWSDMGAAFTAAGSAFTQYVPGTASANSYRLTATPVPAEAFATAQLDNGFVIGATLTSGGSGYATIPAVSITGGGGSGAEAVAVVSNGLVTMVNVMDAGYGYTNAPTITIAPPPPPATALSPMVTQAMELDLGSLSPYGNYQLEFSAAAGGVWSNLGLPFTPTSSTSTQYVNVSGDAGFFRVEYVP
jgi:uncharacterized repeat protein (TIGR03803 family)